MANQNWKVEISTSQPDAVTQTYLDVTADVDGVIEITAGETANAADPGNTCTFNLHNPDQRYTPGNLLSATALKSGRKVRVTETIADQLIQDFTGYIQFPTIEAWTESNPVEPRSQTITVTAVDQIARLDRSRPLMSALAEYVIYNGGTDLKGFWPMTESAEPFAGVGPVAAALEMRRSSSGTTVGARGLVQPQTGRAPDGGESEGARMTIAGVGSSGKGFIETYLPSTFAPALAASDAVTVVFWFAFPPTFNPADVGYRSVVSFTGQSATCQIEMNSSSRTWSFRVYNGMTLASTDVATIGNEALLPIGVYLKESTSTAEIWIGSVREMFALTGTPGGAGAFSWSGIGYQLDYDLSHLQVYVGNSFTYTKFLAQINHAYAPLDQQTTGQRIHTILDYAGYPRGDAFRAIDNGVSVMSAATLSGLSPKDAIDVATETEQGRFYVAGGGQATFADRLRLYNI
jgi:hypothetical protein